jgi:hypothetical protein
LEEVGELPVLSKEPPMKKILSLVLAGAALAAASGAAMASDVRFSVSIGVPAPYVYSPPVVVAPAPVYYPPRVVYAPVPAYSYYGAPRAFYGPRVVVAQAPRAFRHDRGHSRGHDRRW